MPLLFTIQGGYIIAYYFVVCQVLLSVCVVVNLEHDDDIHMCNEDFSLVINTREYTQKIKLEMKNRLKVFKYRWSLSAGFVVGKYGLALPG